MDFHSYLKIASEEVQRALTIALAQWHEQQVIPHPELKKLTDLYEERTAGGKYMRGILVKLGYELSGMIINTEVLKIAAAYELLHTSLLIVDDLIDKSPIRRRKPTIHTVLGNSDYAQAQTICLSDLGFFLATKLMTESTLIENSTLSFFSQTVINTILGEMLDSLLAKTKNRQEQEVITIQKFKTAHYSVAGPLLLGAKLGKLSEANQSALQTYGEAIGIAFQIQDDILGVFGDEEVTGKSSRSDIEEGKNTLLFTFAAEHGTTQQKELIYNYYGKGPIEDKYYDELRTVFQESGAYTYAQEKAKTYINKGKAVIPHITSDETHQQYLSDLADYVTTRIK